MAKSPSKQQQFEDLYPAIAEWIDTRGWIELGQDDMSRSMARVLDEGGMLWEGKSRYASINALFDDVEQAVKTELGLEEDEEEEEEIKEVVAPKSAKKAASAKTKATKAASKPDENVFIPVDSSMITAVRYNARTRELDVIYNSGKVWCYSGVGQKEYEGLMKSSSKGSYMRSNIIDCYPEMPIKLGRK